MSLTESREATIRFLIAHGDKLLDELRSIDCALASLGYRTSFLVQVGRRTVGRPSMMQVVEEISNVTGISVDALLGKGRSRQLFHGRLMVYWFAAHICNLSHTEVGNAMGSRDHSSVSHGHDEVRKRFEFWPEFQSEFLRVQDRLCAHFGMVAEPVVGFETQVPSERFTPIDPAK